MQVRQLHSIQTADKRFSTQTYPVLIGCSDMQSYVCKYGDGDSFAQRLFCEYFAAQMMRHWEIALPDFALIKITPHHIPDNFAIPTKCFNQTCFGSQYSRWYTELTQLNTLTIASFKTDEFKRALLKVALFDCWLANEDRNGNNYNLLFDVAADYRLLAIDNEGVFNTRVFDRPIESLNFYDSVLSSQFAQELYRKKDLTSSLISGLKSYFYTCTQNYQQIVNRVFENVPSDWNIDSVKTNYKVAEVFDDAWKKETIDTFASFVNDLKETL